jgi:hypothetical protein
MGKCSTGVVPANGPGTASITMCAEDLSRVRAVGETSAIVDGIAAAARFARA